MTMNSVLTVLIAEEYKLARDLMSFMLNRNPRLRVIGETDDGEKAVEMARQLNPDIIILGITLQTLDGIEVTQQIIQQVPEARILGVSKNLNTDIARKILQYGAKGYLTKNSGSDELIKAIMEIAEGGSYICNDVKTGIVESIVGEKGTKIPVNNFHSDKARLDKS